ncbi:MAG: hypothetical protein COW08_02710 [Ignavibacteriales bacterium CG12_big_fil_rev_8_21_14_0_65_30_8]|nr:MAG: hypothetical protein COW08_02710 [Ignavibacteriales bacterium CG12_big_fil_rev_8_21_14_0_65_30_8]
MKYYLKKILLYILLLSSNFIFISCYAQLTHTHGVGQDSINKSNNISDIDNLLETKIRMFLYEKYHPGHCFGMPGPVDKRIIKWKLTKHPHLVKIIKERYKPTNENKLYDILSSMISFTLKETQGGYEFSFTDGNCCVITHYKGILYLENNKIIESKITKQETENVPC